MTETHLSEPPSLNPFDQADQAGERKRNGNPFLQFVQPDNKTGPAPEPTAPPPAPKGNPFLKFGTDKDVTATPEPDEGSASGAFRRGFARGVLPAVGGLATFGVGAEAGAAIGALGGPAAPITVPVASLIGGFATSMLGAEAVSSAQSWALSKLPDSWREAIGQDDRQQHEDEKKHGTASFLGGLVPYALAMRPGGISRANLPENATALQRLMANPVTARVFGGAVMGGMEAGQELAHGEGVDWQKTAIATGFGVVFNKPTAIGERLTELSARPTREGIRSMPVIGPKVLAAEAANRARAAASSDSAAAETSRDIDPTNPAHQEVLGEIKQSAERLQTFTEQNRQYLKSIDALIQAEPALPAEPAVPPVASGYTRFFHGGPPEGGNPPDSGGGRWTTTHFTYARDYRRTEDKPGQVWYVDIPKGDPTEVAARGWDETMEGTTQVGLYRSIEVPEHWAMKMRPYKEGAPPAAPGYPSINAMILDHERGRQPPTVAEAGDLKVMGPGITESVFHGSEAHNPTAAMTAHEAARNEAAVLGKGPEPDLHAAARRIEPEAFAHYDELIRQRDTFRRWIEEHRTPSPEALSEIETRQAELQRQHDELVAARGGYKAGPEARRLRAQIREVEAEHTDALSRMVQGAVGGVPDTPEIAAARRHLQATDYELRDLLPEIQAAYRRAADMHEGPAAAEAPAAPAAPPGGTSLASVIAARESNAAPAPIDSSRDVRSGAVASKEPDGPVFIDRHIPQVSPTLKDKDGNPANLWKYLTIHETQERQAMAEGLPYETAHETRATPAERAAVEADGVDWKSYTAEMDGYLSAIEHEGVKNPPPNPHVDPDQAAGGKPHHHSENKPTAAAPAPAAPANVIADDVANRLVAAGRPADEAAAYGKLWAAYYETRAARFNGALGTAEELFRREGARIVGTNEMRRGRPTLEGLPRRAPSSPTGPSARDPETWSLLEFLASRGGIDPADPLIGDVRQLSGGKRKFVPGFGDLVRQGGMRLDRAREAAVEAGYLHDEGFGTEAQATSTVSDLLEAMDTEIRGQRIYKHDRKPEHVLAQEQKEVIADNARHADEQFDEALREAEIDPQSIDDKLRKRTIEIMTREGEHDAMAAYERATTEDASRYIEDAAATENEHELEYFQKIIPELKTSDDGTRIHIEPHDMEVPAWGKGLSWGVTAYRTNIGGEHRIQIRDARLPPEYKGRGVGIAMYKEIADIAHKENAVLASDGTVTLEAAIVWERLRQLGFRIEKNPDVIFRKGPPEAKEQGLNLDRFETADGSPVFRMLPEHEDALEFFQRKRRDLIAEREAQGQMGLPGTERIGQGEQAQRAADQPLKPKAEQKPMDEGLFGDEKGQKELFQFAGPEALTANLEGLKRAKELWDAHVTREQIWADTGWFRGEDGKWKFEIPDNNAVQDFGGKTLGEVLHHPELFAAYPELAKVRVRQTSGENSGFLRSRFLGDTILLGRKQGEENMVNSLHHEIQHWIQEREDFAKGDNYRRHIPWWNLLPSKKTISAALDKYFEAPGEREASLVGERAEGRAGEFPWETSNDTTRRRDYLEWEMFEIRSRMRAQEILDAVGTPDETKYTTEQTLDAIASALGESRSYQQEARGKIRLIPGNKSIITLMKDANASTFGHETGHEFLDQLMRDAEHPAAPDQLKTDAATTLKWLGADTADAIKTRHHEKFARGFEQYLREGTAPSQGLARVFAQFRDWLVQIYQTLKGLGKEISPDIRDVFDRMLATEPQRTIIAPESLEHRPNLHDTHESDAATMEPHEADAAMARVSAEAERAVDDILPEVRNELETKLAKIEAEQQAATGAEPGAAPGGGPGQPGQVGNAGGTGGPVTQGSGGSEGAGAVVGSGGETRPASAGLSGRSGERSAVSAADADRERQRAAADLTRDHPLAPGPADLFGAAESPFTDKAGNIRLENLTTREDVAQAIRDAATANDDFIGDRRGVITDGQVMDLAEDLGMDFQKLDTRKIGEAFNAEQIMAARKLLVQSATDLTAIMRKAAVGTDEDVMLYAAAKDRHQMIQAHVAGITAEAGRALRAFRNIAGMEATQGVDQFLRTATGKTLFQLKQEAKLGAQLGTPQNVSKFMQDAQKRTFGRMLLEYWINGLLSGPATHSTNLIGNAVLMVQNSGPETAAAALIGRARQALGREGEVIRFGELGARLRGLRQGLPSGIKGMAQSFRSGTSMLLPGEKPAALPFQIGNELVPRPMLDEAATYSSLMADAFGTVQGLQDSIVAMGALIKAGGIEGSPLVSAQYSIMGAIPDIAVRGVTALPLGTAIRTPGRFLAAADSFFRAVNYSMAKNATAYRMASNEGLTGTRFDARVAEIRQSPSESMMKSLAGEAAEQTLMEKGGKFLQALSHLSNAEIGGFPLLKFVSPFVHVAGNIINQALIKRTPLAYLSAELRADLTGKNGNIAQDKAMARVLIGTGLSVAFGTLAAQGYATGSGPTDPKEAAMWRLAGNQAYSVRIGDIWYGVQKLGPLGMMLSTAADLHHVAGTASEGEMADAAGQLVHAFSQNILDQSMMKGPAELLRAINDSDRYGEQYVRNFLASFVPFSVGMAQMAKLSDPYSRHARTIVDAMRAKIPGHLNSWFDNELMPKRDIWGEPLLSPETIGGPGVTGIYQRQMSTDPVNQAMLRLGIAPGPVSRKIRNEDLTDQQFDDFARIAGRTTKIRLDTIVNSPDFQGWAPTVQHDVIVNVIRQSREMARGTIMVKYPEIVRQAIEERKAKARGENIEPIQ